MLGLRTWGVVVALTLVACDNGSNVSKLTPDVEAPAEVDFGTVYVTDVLVRDVLVTSTGTGYMSVLDVVENDDALTASHDADHERLGPGSALTVRVTWRPTHDGNHAGFIRITTDVPGKRDLVVVTRGFAKPIPECDEGNPCTDQYFDRASEVCRFTFNSNECNDGSACTEQDRCHEGVCRAVARTCNDDNPCTFNLCDPARGCFFPEGAIHCDDGDPCTKNVCDKDDGCEYPDADDGTPCGEFSCSEANVCIIGFCTEFDISGTSDGFPCSDGDECTEGDSCLDGECESGPAREEPILTASLPIYGMTGGAATDGLRYAFLGDGALTLLTVMPSGELSPESQTAMTGSHVVTRAPGLFLALTDDALWEIDATDAATPEVVDRSLAHTDAPAFDTVSLRDGRALVAMQSGAVLAATLVYVAAGVETSAPGIWFVPANGAAPLVELTSLAGPSHVAAGQDSVAWASDAGIAWRRLSVSGQTIEALDLAARPNVRALSVLGRELAILEEGQVTLLRIEPAAMNPPASCDGCDVLQPGCGATPLPAPGAYQLCETLDTCGPGRACVTVSIADCDEAGCVPQDCELTASVCLSTLTPFSGPPTTVTVPADAEDVLRLDGALLVASPTEGVVRIADAEPETLIAFDVLGANRLMASDNGVFFEAVRGAIVPRMWNETLGVYARVSGPGLGGVRGVTQLGTGARIAGGVSRATLRLDDDPAFMSWSLSTEGPDEAPSSILIRGDGVPSLLSIGGASVSNETCTSGAAWVLRELAAPSVDRTLCAHDGAAPSVFVAERVLGLSGSGEVVAWSLANVDPVVPAVFAPPEPGVELWAAREGTVLALRHASGAVSFFDGDLDSWADVGTWDVDAEREPLAYARTELLSFADTTFALELFDIASSVGASNASLPIPTDWSDVQVLAMQDAQAWLTARDADPQDNLVQLSYDASANELIAMGQLAWPLTSHPSLARVVDAFALGDFVVVVRNSDVGVVQPACQ